MPMVDLVQDKMWIIHNVADFLDKAEVQNLIMWRTSLLLLSFYLPNFEEIAPVYVFEASQRSCKRSGMNLALRCT